MSLHYYPHLRPILQIPRELLHSLGLRGPAASDAPPPASEAASEAKRLRGVHRLRDRVIAARDPFGSQGFAGLHQGELMRQHEGAASMWTLLAFAGLCFWLGVIIACAWMGQPETPRPPTL